MTYLDTSALVKRFLAIHLASALHLAQSLEEVIPFAAADTRLLQAAAAEGLRPINVETE